jgi:hypothetical protein
MKFSKAIFITFLVISPISIFCQQKRNVLAVPGAYPTSFLLDRYVNTLSNTPPIGPGFKIEPIFDLGVYVRESGLEDNIKRLDLMPQDFPNFNFDNILGIGHDVGGLALRGTTNLKITGKILINVPNNGSGLMQSFFYPTSKQKEPMSWIDDLERMSDYEECGYCDKIENIKKYIENILLSEPMLKPASNVPDEYVRSLTKPDPSNTAVIWSNANGLTLSDLLGRNNGLGPVDLQACAEDGIASSFGRIAHDFLMNAINGIAGINEISISERINRINGADRNTRKNIMCRLSDKKLESDWRLRIVQDKVTYISETNSSSCESLNKETFKALVSNFLTPNEADVLYFTYCEPTYSISVIEPTSLLYSKSEQTLGNEYVTKEFKGTHYDPIIIDNYPFLLDFFEGKYGDAYKLPK